MSLAYKQDAQHFHGSADYFRKYEHSNDRLEANVNRLLVKLLTILLIVLPGLMQATSEGPQQPEYVQFEQVDASDMVNLVSGDFTYNIPIMEVPGPNGSYPINLSYHAGIGPNQEATWVGLGWTINAGAINRQVNGYPDDYNGDLISTHIYSTEKIRGHGIGIGFGWGPFGLNMSFDLNTGKMGANASIEILQAMTKFLPVGSSFFNLGPLRPSLDISVGTAGFSSSSSISYGYGLSNNLALSTSVNLQSQQVGFNLSAFDADYGNSISLVGMSFSSSGNNLSLAGGSASSAAGTSKAMQFSQYSFAVAIPLPSQFWCSFSYWEYEYWLDEWIHELSYGYLSKNDFLEVYDDNGRNDYRFESERVDDYLKNAQDSYSVAAWGLSGQIMPMDKKINELYLIADGEKSILESSDSPEIEFLFIGDNGGYFRSGSGTQNFYQQSRRVEALFSASGELNGFHIYAQDGKKYSFCEKTSILFQRTTTFTDIGNNNLGDIVNESVIGSRYAHSWLLSSIEGPDFIDYNNNGDYDSEDFGYWVKFTYDENDDEGDIIYSYRSPWSNGGNEYATIARSKTVRVQMGIKTKRSLRQ
jgi:hypothetical protein